MIEIFSDPKILFPTVTSVVAGIWILKDFLLKRELYPKPEVIGGIKLLADATDTKNAIAIATISVKNSGLARLYFDRAEFSIRIIDDQEIPKEISINSMILVDFPLEVCKRRAIFPKVWGYSFVDAGGTSRYKIPILLPQVSGSIVMSVKIHLREKKSDFISDVSFFKWNGKDSLEKINLDS